MYSFQRLVEKASYGDKEAFRKLYQMFKEMVYKTCWIATLERESAKDLFQEIWLKVYLWLPKLKEPQKFSEWLRTLIDHTIIDYIRNKKREKRKITLSSENLGLIKSYDYDFTNKIEAQELMKCLTPKERYIFYLYYFEELSIKEISEKLELGLSAVKMILHRGRKKLKRILYETERKKF